MQRRPREVRKCVADNQKAPDADFAFIRAICLRFDLQEASRMDLIDLIESRSAMRNKQSKQFPRSSDLSADPPSRSARVSKPATLVGIAILNRSPDYRGSCRKRPLENGVYILNVNMDMIRRSWPALYCIRQHQHRIVNANLCVSDLPLVSGNQSQRLGIKHTNEKIDRALSAVHGEIRSH